MKRTEIKRKVSLRDSYLKKLKARGTEHVWKRNGKVRRKRPLKKVSRSQRTRLQGYYAKQQEFLKRDENQNCLVCQRLREIGHNILLRPATETHHKFGRIGRLLTWEPGFVPCCRDHREWIHANPKLSREIGVLCEPAQWNVFPEKRIETDHLNGMVNLCL